MKISGAHLKKCALQKPQYLFGIFFTDDFVCDFLILDFGRNRSGSHLIDQLWQVVLEALRI